MLKTLVLLLTLCSSVALAQYCVEIKNNAGKTMKPCTPIGDRICECVKNTQTASIRGVNGGNIKLFSSDDCTGNYQTLGSNSIAPNAQWVNSFSWGGSGSSSGPDGYCPNYFAL